MDAITTGTPQTAFVQDAARQSQFAQSFFYTLGDIFSGTDASLRMSSGAGNSVDVAVDQYGQPYVRGTTQGLGTQANQANQARGITLSPELLVMGAVFLYFVTRKA